MTESSNGRLVKPPPIVGLSRSVSTAIELLERYAPTRLPLLLVGATGTGKDLFAEHAHWRSGRPGRLLAVNCAALPRDTAESLLFGHRKGAFTGAIESHPGYFRLAHGSTLFLDELLSLPVECQAKLLRAVETREIWPLGEREPVRVDVRVVAAVQDDIAERLRDGSFRRDLYERLKGVVIYLPPLAARPEDVIPLARHFADLHGQRIDSATDRVLLSYPWPGNVRELRQVIERAQPLSENGVLRANVLAKAIDLGAEPCVMSSDRLGQQSSRDCAAEERDRLLAIMSEVGWDTILAAERLRVHRATVYRRLLRLGLTLPVRRAFARIRANGCEFARIETSASADDTL